MTTGVVGWWSVVNSTRIAAAVLLLIAIGLAACSIPNLEEPDCASARGGTREFYSFHFGNDMSPTEESVRLREKYLTSRLSGELLTGMSRLPAQASDYFTATPKEDLPKAFRVGECKLLQPGEKVEFQILLFWKSDARSEQKHVNASVKKENGAWLIDAVSP